jgi:cytochrome c1
MQGYGDNFIPVIPIDYPEHTEGKPFCWNGSYPCHEEDHEAIARVAQWVEDGLLTPDEATQYILGRTL